MIKDLERVRPEAILDLGRAGAVLGACVPGVEASREVGEVVGGCGKGGVIHSVVEEPPKPAYNDEGNELETEFTLASLDTASLDSKGSSSRSRKERSSNEQIVPPISENGRARKQPPPSKKSLVPGQQTMGKCVRCGYLTSQDVCKACMLLEGLNKNRPKIGISVDDDFESQETNGIGRRKLVGEALLEVT